MSVQCLVWLSVHIFVCTQTYIYKYLYIYSVYVCVFCTSIHFSTQFSKLSPEMARHSKNHWKRSFNTEDVNFTVLVVVVLPVIAVVVVNVIRKQLGSLFITSLLLRRYFCNQASVCVCVYIYLFANIYSTHTHIYIHIFYIYNTIYMWVFSNVLCPLAALLMCLFTILCHIRCFCYYLLVCFAPLAVIVVFVIVVALISYIDIYSSLCATFSTTSVNCCLYVCVSYFSCYLMGLAFQRSIFVLQQ